MDEFEIPEEDDDLANSKLAEALVRLCPHLQPETERPNGIGVDRRSGSTLH